MLIREVAELGPDKSKLEALANFLIGRAEDESAAKEISQDAFVDLAQGLGINISKANLPDLINEKPLVDLLEPPKEGSNMLRFVGNNDNDAADESGMSVDQARDVVNANAKAAMKRRQ